LLTCILFLHKSQTHYTTGVFRKGGRAVNL